MATSRFRQLLAADCLCVNNPRCSCVVVDSALSSVVLSLLGPFVLMGMALFWMVSGSPWWVVLMLGLGVVVLVVVLYDMPVAAVFNSEGVTRRTPLRDHHLAWPEIERLILAGSKRNPGLAARVGGRSYLLADRADINPEQLGMLSQMRPSS